MICPVCKAEYRRGVTQCNDCGVSLVDTLEASAMELQPQPQEGEGELVSVWSGNDPGECATVKEALEKAGIPFTDQASRGYFIFPSMRLRVEIRVPSSDAERARKLLLDLEGRVDPQELTPEEIESLALPESDVLDDREDTTTWNDLPDSWDDDEAVSEVWSGEKEEFATTLVACLREIGIPSRKLTESGRTRLLVRPEDEARAKEIVREVVEAKPPQ
jgi:hypothetical protein